MRNIIGFWGYPNPSLIEKYKTSTQMLNGWIWILILITRKTAILPENYCSIIKNIFNNAFYLKENLITILAPVGKGQVRFSLFAVQILKE